MLIVQAAPSWHPLLLGPALDLVAALDRVDMLNYSGCFAPLFL